jgi:transglutaminase/protease-like cytokinesis protein 3
MVALASSGDLHGKLRFLIPIVAGIAIVLLVIFFKPATSENSSIDKMFMSEEERSVDDYVSNMRGTQAKSQRDSTIQLYISLLQQGATTKQKVLTPDEAPEICELAKSVSSAGESYRDKAELISEYIVTEIEYDWGNIVVDATGKPRTKSKKDPREVLESGTGICGELSNTYMLMTRCVGIESYFIWGGGHAWNALVIDGTVYEPDTTQGCFICDITKPEHSYPLIGLCDLDRCIKMTDIASLAASQQSIFDQTMGK